MAFIIPLIHRNRIRNNRIIKIHLRDTMNPFDLPEKTFVKQYRMTQRIAFELIDEIRPFADPLGTIPIEIQVLSVLNFFASGSYQFRIGGDAFNSVSQSTMSRYIDKYTTIITRHLAPNYIRFPANREEMNIKRQEFERKYHFPGTIGIIDGTHVAISAVNRRIEHAFVNRKGFHSLNVQIVCDANLLIMSVNARYPGSTHDAFIYSNSIVYTKMEEYYNENPNEWNWLLGDSAYPLKPWLMKNFQGDNLTPIEQNFNLRLRRPRHSIERLIGILKMRFRCILGERQLRYEANKVGRIVYSCATLHNFLLLRNFDIMRNINENRLQNVINHDRRLNNAGGNEVEMLQRAEERRNQVAQLLHIRR